MGLLGPPPAAVQIMTLRTLPLVAALAVGACGPASPDPDREGEVSSYGKAGAFSQFTNVEERP